MPTFAIETNNKAMFLLASILLILSEYGLIYGVLAIFDRLSKKDRKQGVIITAISLLVFLGCCIHIRYDLQSIEPVEWPEELPELIDMIVWE